jgi:hypothetical protein
VYVKKFKANAKEVSFKKQKKMKILTDTMTKKAARKRTSLTFPHLLSSVSKEEKKKLDFFITF